MHRGGIQPSRRGDPEDVRVDRKYRPPERKAEDTGGRLHPHAVKGRQVGDGLVVAHVPQVIQGRTSPLLHESVERTLDGAGFLTGQTGDPHRAFHVGTWGDAYLVPGGETLPKRRERAIPVRVRRRLTEDSEDELFQRLENGLLDGSESTGEPRAHHGRVGPGHLQAPRFLPASAPSTATRAAEPRTDHTIGNTVPSTFSS